MELQWSQDPFLPFSAIIFIPQQIKHNSVFASIGCNILPTFREHGSHDVVEILKKQAWNLQKSYKNGLNTVRSNEYQLCTA